MGKKSAKNQWKSVNICEIETRLIFSCWDVWLSEDFSGTKAWPKPPWRPRTWHLRCQKLAFPPGDGAAFLNPRCVLIWSYQVINEGFHGKIIWFSWENHLVFMGKSSGFYGKIIWFSWENHLVFMGKSSGFHGKIIWFSWENHLLNNQSVHVNLPCCSWNNNKTTSNPRLKVGYRKKWHANWHGNRL